MAALSVYVNKDDFATVQNMALSPAKVFKIGLLVLKEGGITNFEEKIKSLASFKEEISKVMIENEGLKKRIDSLKDEIVFLRKKYVLTEDDKSDQ